MPYKQNCKHCNNEMYRMYLRTKYLKSSLYGFSRVNTGHKRGFENIGWYCNNCKRFELDKFEDEQKEQKQQNIIDKILVDRGYRI